LTHPSGHFSGHNISVLKILHALEVRNFACFWSPNFCGGELPEFLDLHYKIQPVSDHVAKFHGDRPRELGAGVAS